MEKFVDKSVDGRGAWRCVRRGKRVGVSSTNHNACKAIECGLASRCRSGWRRREPANNGRPREKSSPRDESREPAAHGEASPTRPGSIDPRSAGKSGRPGGRPRASPGITRRGGGSEPARRDRPPRHGLARCPAHVARVLSEGKERGWLACHWLVATRETRQAYSRPRETGESRRNPHGCELTEWAARQRTT